jgi:hypothetical protein
MSQITEQPISHCASLRRVRTSSGTYTLTITAADECGVGPGEGHLPDEARIRKYVAVVTQKGQSLDLELSGSVFVGLFSETPLARFRGTLEPGRAVFTFDPWTPWDYGQFLVERLANGFYVPEGTIAVALRGNHLVGVLQGTLSLLKEHGVPMAWCSSETHQFVLSR